MSTSDSSYQNHKQLWVTAVDLNPAPGKDPSHPAFLLRGQDESTINMSGYWTLAACQSNGASCAEGFECCSGFCRPDAQGKPVCSPPPVNECSKTGEKCVTAADCCQDSASLACVGGFCSLAKPLGRVDTDAQRRCSAGIAGRRVLFGSFPSTTRTSSSSR